MEGENLFFYIYMIFIFFRSTCFVCLVFYSHFFFERKFMKILEIVWREINEDSQIKPFLLLFKIWKKYNNEKKRESHLLTKIEKKNTRFVFRLEPKCQSVARWFCVGVVLNIRSIWIFEYIFFRWNFWVCVCVYVYV